MNWFKDVFGDPGTVESTLLILALVIGLGLALGSISMRGMRLGVAGILFVGLFFGHFGLIPNPVVLSFTREFGLVLFVFSVGLRVGPGFFNSLRRQGLPLNVLAAAVVALGLAITVASMVGLGVTGPIAVGLFSGATTNTPSLAAAGQALRDYPPTVPVAQQALAQVLPDHPFADTARSISDDERDELIGEVNKLPAMAYAVSYPGGVLGIILAIVLLRWMFRVDPDVEVKAIEERQRSDCPPLINRHVKVTNANLFGLTIGDIPAVDDLGVVVSRVVRGVQESVAHDKFELMSGDVLLAVGEPKRLNQFARIVGEVVTVDVSTVNSQLQARWVIVSDRRIADQTIEELALSPRFGVQVTRVRRSGVELPPLPEMHLRLGDEIRIVGLVEDLGKTAAELGDSRIKLDRPDFLPIFIGIALGILVGSVPFSLPGMSGTVKLGLAGGPLLVAILLSRVYRMGPIVWYLPRSANMALSDVGIALFLASVGLKSGDVFVESFTQGSGFLWFGIGTLITIVPLLVVGSIAYYVVGERYLTITGMLAGSMTDPPALAFANSLAGSEIPSISYATVYPLTMILRIIAAQLLMMYWAGQA